MKKKDLKLEDIGAPDKKELVVNLNKNNNKLEITIFNAEGFFIRNVIPYEENDIIDNRINMDSNIQINYNEFVKVIKKTSAKTGFILTFNTNNIMINDMKIETLNSSIINLASKIELENMHLYNISNTQLLSLEYLKKVKFDLENCTQLNSILSLVHMMYIEDSLCFYATAGAGLHYVTIDMPSNIDEKEQACWPSIWNPVYFNNAYLKNINDQFNEIGFVEHISNKNILLLKSNTNILGIPLQFSKLENPDFINKVLEKNMDIHEEQITNITDFNNAKKLSFVEEYDIWRKSAAELKVLNKMEFLIQIQNTGISATDIHHKFNYKFKDGYYWVNNLYVSGFDFCHFLSHANSIYKLNNSLGTWLRSDNRFLFIPNPNYHI